MNPATEERRLITILFADLSGFTALSSKLDPEEVRDFANICFEHLNGTITSQDGTVHKYEGDLVVALFGFPTAQEDAPESAIRAAFDMLKLMPKISDMVSTRLKIKTDIGLHVGVNSGIVVVGEVGSAEKRDNTIMGDAVNIASRLKDMAKRGEILVSESVFKSSRYLFEYEVLPPVAVKGIDEPVKIFRPIKMKDKPEPKRGIKGLYSPLVGRDGELQSLKQSLEKLTSGKGGAAFVLGDAGLGKSRLWEELKNGMVDRSLPITIIEGRCLFNSETIPYWPFLQVLGTVFGLTDQDSKDVIREKLLKKTKEVLSNEWADVVPYIGYLFSIRFTDNLDEKVKYLDAKAVKLQIMIGINKLFAALAHRQPILFVIEDYHWIDTGSLELLEFIFGSSKLPPVLFLGLSRIEKDRTCYKTKEKLKEILRDDFQEIILRPLDADESAELVRNLLKIPGFTKEFMARILARVEGNPFYLEEIIRSLIDSNVLIFSSGVWRLTADVSSLQIPDTIHTVIKSRLDRLDPESRGVLQTASVVGRNFYGPILEQLCGLDSLILTLHLATLEEYEYIKELKRFPDLEYMFRHPLLQEVTYNGLLKKKRREVHGKAGEVIERLYKNRLDDFAELLALQYANSDNSIKALEWLSKAGQKARDRYANDEAIAYYQKMISIINGEKREPTAELCLACEAIADIYALKGIYPAATDYYRQMESASAGNAAVRSRAKRKTAEIYHNLGRYDDALACYDEAEKLLSGNTQDETLEKSKIHIARGGIWWLKGEMNQAIEEAEAGLKVLVQLPGEEPKIKMVKASAYNRFGSIYFDQGNYGQAIEFYQKSLAALKEINDKQAIARASANLGIVYHVTGDLDQALNLYQTCRQILDEIGDKSGLGKILNNLGNVYYAKGKYDRAFELFQKSLDISKEIGNQRSIGIAYGNLATIYEARGDNDKAIEFYQKGLQTFEEIGYKHGIAETLNHLATVNIKINAFNKGEEYLLRAEEILKAVGSKHGLVVLYAHWAELKNKVAGPGLAPDKEALDYAGKAIKLANELGVKDSIALCYVTYGKIFTAAYDLKTAEGYFIKAIEIFEERKDRALLANTYFEYAKMLKMRTAENIDSINQADEYLEKALRIYRELDLANRVKEVEGLKSQQTAE
ncbi:MAG TPA: tetratricopeptide repeat protein [bacterium]